MSFNDDVATSAANFRFRRSFMEREFTAVRRAVFRPLSSVALLRDVILN